MIAKIAHELRSPLTSIKGFSATLLKRWERFDDGQRLDLIETIAADAERMGRIVSEVLDLARLEAGRLELSVRPTELRPLAERALRLCAALEGADRVRLQVPGDLIVSADPERLGHVLFNLIENAIRFSDEGPIEVRATAAGDQVVIEVEDHGIGIEPERLGAVFAGPASGAGVSVPSGSGLGLYLARRLVEAHGGELTVASVLGGGSTFTLRLQGGRP
jgi:signal transduction histidine kinase